MFVTLCCTVSSYMYAAMAAFRSTEEGSSFILSVLFETIFAIDMLTNFLLSYSKQGSHSVPERKIAKTAEHYFRTNFTMDLIPLIPF
jgi:hypothetical protein